MMAEEEGQQLPYVSEIVLKKRKIRDELAITRRTQLELGKYGAKKSKKQSDVSDIKRPEQIIKEFRDKVFFFFFAYLCYGALCSIIFSF